MHCKTITTIFGIIAIIFGFMLYANMMVFDIPIIGGIILVYGIILIVVSYMAKK